MQTIVLKSGRERSLLNRHPWVFSGAVKQMPVAENGEIVQVLDNHNKLLGYGFFSTNSQITVRLFEFTDVPVELNKDYWIQKIVDAHNYRMQVVDFSETNIYRLVHAEGDFFSGVIIDVYADVAVIQLLIRGTEHIREAIYEGLRKVGIKYIYLKTKQSTQRLEEVGTESGWVGDACEMPVSAKENGITILVDVEKGQKTGFFIDQRENRRLVGVHAQGKKVLNTFSYSGGFSLQALAQGAILVHSVDSSKDAIEMCDRNVAANFPNAPHESFVEDCFDYLNRTEVDYDIMVLDPPAFAKNARSVPNASRGYKNLNYVAFKKIKPGGLIYTFSCSQHIDRDLFRKIVFSAAADAKRNVRIVQQLTQPEDHPINIFHPEGEYLKGLLLHVS
ncbi:MAG: class I SAM-dependent rRNA methyltransferase [Bacteroidota bacterium]